jgi:flagellar hook assembly protein FlgD
MELSIYNIRGQLVRTLVSGVPHQKGEYQVTWDGKNDSGKPVTSGVYFSRMSTPGFNQVNKMLLLK